MYENCRVTFFDFILVQTKFSPSVCHERSKEYYKQENSNEFAYITADEYTASELIEMEKIILNLLGFKLNAPNAIHFLKVYVTLLQIPEQITIIALVISMLMNKFLFLLLVFG